MKVGIVGGGFIGTVHSFAIRGILDAGLVDASVTHVFDSDRDKARAMAELHGAEIAADVAALADAVDAVWVCTPTAAHLRIVEAAVERGCAVFCEKPLGRDLGEAEKVAAALQRVPHRVGLVLRTAPVFRALRGELGSGRHGRPMAVVFRDDQYFPVGGIYGSTWRAEVAHAGGGTLIEHSIHDVDLLRWLFGDPESTSGRVANFAGNDGVEDLAVAEMVFPGGTVATLTSVWHRVLSRTSTRRVEVFCEDALLWLDDDNLGPLHVERSDGTTTVDGTEPSWASTFDLPEELRKPLVLYARQALDVLEGLAGDGPTGPTVSEALAAHRLVDAVYRSAADGGETVML